MKPWSEKQVLSRFSIVWESWKSYADSTCNEDILSALASSLVSALLPKKKKLTEDQNAALGRSIRHLNSKTLTESVLRSNLYRLIANWYFILDGIDIPVWDGHQETSDAEILGIIRRSVVSGNRVCFELKIKLKTGVCAGIITCVLLSDSQISYFLDHIAGTSKYKCNVEEISGMKARLLVEYSGNMLHVISWSCTAAQKEHNKKLTSARGEPAKCNRGIPCNVCKATTTQCPLAIWVER